ISGFIETNSTPELCSIEELCKNKGFDIEVNENTTNNIHATIRDNQMNISLFVTDNGINYKTKIPNLFSYAFISVIIIALLFRLLPLGVWIMLLFFVPLVLIAIKVVYDKRVYKIVDSVIPESLKFLPEKATKEQLEWLKNPNVCPACGTERNPYHDKCLECGLHFGAIKKLIDNQSQTGTKEVKIIYKNEK
ncbi:MAG TPA: hypothetical protein PLS84_08410, partial [Salinivirgaceae bacterium]|nr:hypothetical protein [Salinivirgaceae bacterium]